MPNNYFHKRLKKRINCIALVTISFILQACGNVRLAPVEERHATGQKASSITSYPQIEVDARTKLYQVQAGDTLYSIAFRYGVDFKTLAQVNGIGRDYLINPGQQLNIEKARQAGNVQISSVQTNGDATPIAARERVVSAVPAENNRTTQSRPRVESISRTPVVVAKPPAVKPATTKPATTKLPVSKPVASKPKTTTKPPVKTVTKPAVRTGPKVVANDQFSKKKVAFWMWPSVGKLIKTFNQGKLKGIDIAGNMGQAVRAAAAGRVVYAGKGLRGYGNLIIIKHNNDFISAYAHNKVIEVKENEIIKAGQKIAEIGNTESDMPKLHFEIRFKGKPVDPLRYLPKR